MRARAFTLAAMLCAAGMAHAGTRSVKSLDGVPTGARVRMEGVLSMRGSTPLTILVLEVTNDVVVTLRPHDADMQQALASLDGLRVALEGEVIPPLDPGTPRLDVDHYDLLASPDGEEPIIGVIAMENGACVVATDQGKRYWITGGVAPALCEHAGTRVWMVGKKAKHAEGTKPRESTAFTPTGYGVIDNAP